MPRIPIATLFFDDLNVGDEWESPSRTITEADVTNFAGVSGDFNSIHVDHDAASSGPFRRPIAHGLLGLSVASGLTAHSPRVETLAFLRLVEWNFLQPIFFGDTVRVITLVEALESRSRGRRGMVTWRRRLLNQDSETVQEGRSQTLVRGRGPSRDTGNDPSDDQS